MKRLLLLILASFLCSQICFAEERTIILSLKDGSEVSGEDLGYSNGVYKVRTDSGIVNVKSSDVEGIEQKVHYSLEELGINKDDMKKALEEINNRLENASDNQYEDESNDSAYQSDSYEEEYNDSNYQNDSYEEYSNDSDFQNDSYEEDF